MLPLFHKGVLRKFFFRLVLPNALSFNQLVKVFSYCLSFIFFLSVPVFGQLEFGPRVKLTDPISNMEGSRIVDMDGDGDIDVVAIGLTIKVDWFENDGNGNFTRHNWMPEKLIDQSIIGIADHDGDGRQDIWLEEHEEGVENNSRYRFFVAKGQAGGGFSSPTSVAVTPDISMNGSVSLVADLNGDGYFDILCRRFIFLGTQERSFLAPILVSPGIDFDNRGNKIQDYDKDGDLDLFIRDESNKQILYSQNTGSGQLAEPITLIALAANQDLDGFSVIHSEIASAPPLLVVLVENDETNDQKIFLYERQNNGTALKIEEFDLPNGVGQDFKHWSLVRPEPSSTRVFLCCLVDGGATSQLHELKYGEAGFAINFLNTHRNLTSFDFTGEADLNGDGLKDLVVMIPSLAHTSDSATDHILWYSGNMDGSFQQNPAPVVPPSYERSLLIADDLDGDGDTDLMFGLSSPLDYSRDETGVAVWLNHGNGTQFERRAFAIPGNSQAVLGVEDFVTQPIGEGDLPTGLPFDLPLGRKDFIIRSNRSHQGASAGTSEVHLAFQSAQGDFHVELVASDDSDSLIYYVDWDGDGAEDLLFYSSDGELSWSKRTGYVFGQRQEIVSFPTDPVDPINPAYKPQTKNFALLDIDRDGDLDVYGQGSFFEPDSIYWAERSADGSILQFNELDVPLNLLFFDANGDGVRESTALFGNSGGINPNVDFHFANTELSSLHYTNFGLFDFDADGDFDTLLSAPTSFVSGLQRLICWRENQGGGPSFTDVTAVVFAGVEMSQRNQFAHRDMDGDGTKDLVVVSGDTALVEWFKITNRRGPQAFEDWMAVQNLKGSSAGPRGDWDMDGRKNWEEFIFGTQAEVGDSGHGLEPRIEKTSEGIDFIFTRRKSGEGLNLNYGIQRSNTLNGDWEPWNPEVALPTSVGEYESIRIPITPGENTEFFRVQLPEIPE